MELVVHESGTAVADAAASLIADSINNSGDRFSLGLAGGSTPEETYRRMRDLEVDWSKVDAWLSDERWVAGDSDRSNGRMADITLFRHTDAVLHRPAWGVSPDDSAEGYESLLRQIHHGKQGPELILLGLGADGHTASLFPGSAALDESNHWFVANTIPESGEIRLTATYPLLDSASTIVFLVVGTSKAAALKASFAGTTPAGRVGSQNGRVLWFVDEEAASLVI